VKRKLPGRSASIEFMPVPVDTTLFKQAAFDRRDGVFRVVFSGRLDEFKDPPTMFRTFEAVHRRLRGRFEFHYVGTTDPHRYAEFAAIGSSTVRHGHDAAPEVAAISRAAMPASSRRSSKACPAPCWSFSRSAGRW